MHQELKNLYILILNAEFDCCREIDLQVYHDNAFHIATVCSKVIKLEPNDAPRA